MSLPLRHVTAANAGTFSAEGVCRFVDCVYYIAQSPEPEAIPLEIHQSIKLSRGYQAILILKPGKVIDIIDIDSIASDRRKGILRSSESNI